MRKSQLLGQTCTGPVLGGSSSRVEDRSPGSGGQSALHCDVNYNVLYREKRRKVTTEDEQQKFRRGMEERKKRRSSDGCWLGGTEKKTLADLGKASKNFHASSSSRDARSPIDSLKSRGYALSPTQHRVLVGLVVIENRGTSTRVQTSSCAKASR